MLSKAKTYLQEHKWLFIASITYLVIRLILLDHAFLLRGERDITLTGYFLAQTGRDMYGNFLPREFYGIDMPTPLLSFYNSALWYVIIPIKNVFFARLPYVVATTTYVFLIYEIVRNITRNRTLGIVTALVFISAPGIYHVSRLALEVNIATPLLLLGILLFIKKQRWYSYLVFTLSFFAYNGFRPLILPLLVFLELYFLFLGEKWKNVSKYLAISVLFYFALVGVGMFFVDGGLTLSRKADLVFLSYQDVEPQVIFRRNTAIGPELLKSVFNNKITATGYYMIEVFIKSQDFNYLFFKGDPSAIYASTFGGMFFMVFLPMYYLGFFFLAKKWNFRYFYILGFIPVGLFPSIINIDYISFTIRSILSTVGYAYIIASGILLFIQLIIPLRKSIRIILVGTLVMILSIEVAYFSYNYFFRRPKTMFESFFESEKNMGQYLLSQKTPVTIYDDSPRNILATYYFLNPKLNVTEAQQTIAKGEPYHTNSFILQQCLREEEKYLNKKGIIIADSCMSEDFYKKVRDNGKVDKIWFEDYSERFAFAIFK